MVPATAMGHCCSSAVVPCGLVGEAADDQHSRITATVKEVACACGQSFVPPINPSSVGTFLARRAVAAFHVDCFGVAPVALLAGAVVATDHAVVPSWAVQFNMGIAWREQQVAATRCFAVAVASAGSRACGLLDLGPGFESWGEVASRSGAHRPPSQRTDWHWLALSQCRGTVAAVTMAREPPHWCKSTAHATESSSALDINNMGGLATSTGVCIMGVIVLCV